VNKTGKGGKGSRRVSPLPDRGRGGCRWYPVWGKEKPSCSRRKAREGEGPPWGLTLWGGKEKSSGLAGSGEKEGTPKSLSPVSLGRKDRAGTTTRGPGGKGGGPCAPDPNYPAIWQEGEGGTVRHFIFYGLKRGKREKKRGTNCARHARVLSEKRKGEEEYGCL